MSQFSDHHADDYEPYEGHPDGKDLYDAHMEMKMIPSLDEQMSSPEFRLKSLEMWVHNWTPRIQQMEKDIASINSHLFPKEIEEVDRAAAWNALCARINEVSEPDDFDTQAQVEEELPPEFWEEEVTQLTTVNFTLENGTVFEMKFPNLESALKFTEGMS